MHPVGLRMVARKWMAAAALAGLNAVGVAATSADFAIAKVDSQGRLLLITGTKLDPNGVVHLQYPAAKGDAACCQRLKASQFKVSQEEIVTENELTHQDALVYETRIPASWKPGPYVVMAVLGDFQPMRSRQDVLEGRAPKGPLLRATLCTSSEGVHLQAQRGPGLRTHLYLWMGESIADPTCKE